MMELISNSRNNNGIAVYVQKTDGTPARIIKTSYTANGIRDLLREYDGWTWYHENDLCPGLPRNCLITARRHSFVRIDIGHIEGTGFDYRRPIAANMHILRKCIEWYIERWPYVVGAAGPIHGDFSLGNLIESDGRLVLIDWEHFAPDRAPWGIDMLALVLETVYLSRLGQELRDRDVTLTKPLLEALAATGRLERRFISRPLWSLRAFIRDSRIWEDQLLKLPVLHYSDPDVARVDSLLGSRPS